MWRSRWAWTTPRPARRAASATIWLTPLDDSARCGAFTRTNTVRPRALAGRPWRRYPTDKGVRATFFVPGHTALAYPALAREVLDAGHEIGHHGFVHEKIGALSPEDERAVFARGQASLQDVLSAHPVGYRSPSWEFTPETLRILVDHGLLYDSSLMGSDFIPYFVRVGDRFATDQPYHFGEATSVMEFPVSWVLDDFPYFELVRGRSAGLRSPDEVLDIWTAEFDF